MQASDLNADRVSNETLSPRDWNIPCQATFPKPDTPL